VAVEGGEGRFSGFGEDLDAGKGLEEFEGGVVVAGGEGDLGLEWELSKHLAGEVEDVRGGVGIIEEVASDDELRVRVEREVLAEGGPVIGDGWGGGECEALAGEFLFEAEVDVGKDGGAGWRVEEETVGSGEEVGVQLEVGHGESICVSVEEERVRVLLSGGR
jgi:hypothetical protein